MKVWVVRDGQRGEETSTRLHTTVEGAGKHIKEFLSSPNVDGDFYENFSEIELDALQLAIDSPGAELIMRWWSCIGHKCSHLNIIYEELELEP
jgi:hypothetical protein